MKILLGPENLTFISDFIYKGFTADHDVITFNDRRKRGLQFQYPESTFDMVLAQLPPGWEPDLVVWWFPEFQPLLPGIDRCPYPTLLCMSDWHVTSDPIREIAPAFDLVATDRTGLELLEGTPGASVFYSPLYGYDPDVHRVIPGHSKAMDISHVGDLNPALHGQRLRHLAKAVDLCSRYEVMFYTNVYGEPYVKLMNESRITLNVTLRGEMAMRCYEAPACGSLLFCEESNKEIREFLTDRESCVLFNEENLQDLLIDYLEHPERLEQAAKAGRRAIEPYTYRHQMNRLLKTASERTSGGRPFRDFEKTEKRIRLARQAHQALNEQVPLTALHQTEKALALRPGDPLLHNLLGCASARAADAERDLEKRILYRKQAETSLRDAFSLGVMPRLNLARLMLRTGRKREAAEVLKEAVDQPYRQAAFYAPLMDFFRFEWERCRPNREPLARWQVHELLAELDPDQAADHALQALEHRPGIGVSWLRLARCLTQTSDKKLGALQKALQIEPTSPWVRFELIRTHWTRGETEEAMTVALETSRILAALPFPEQATQMLHQLLDELKSGKST